MRVLEINLNARSEYSRGDHAVLIYRQAVAVLVHFDLAADADDAQPLDCAFRARGDVSDLQRSGLNRQEEAFEVVALDDKRFLGHA
jgi:hypothetical protein